LGRPIELVITSEDVIHSLYIPAFRIKQDAVPGRYTSTWFEATKIGTFHIFCAEYCGAEHSLMRGSVIVMEPSAYDAWLSNNEPEASPAMSGQALFESKSCHTCHRTDSDARAPYLQSLYGDTVMLTGGGSVVADDQYLRESILEPTAKVVSGYQPIMPTFKGQLDEDEVRELIEYIKSMGEGEGDAPAGE
jgi:cytochrome c oxidase subunit 2